MHIYAPSWRMVRVNLARKPVARDCSGRIAGGFGRFDAVSLGGCGDLMLRELEDAPRPDQLFLQLRLKKAKPSLGVGLYLVSRTKYEMLKGTKTTLRTFLVSLISNSEWKCSITNI